MEKITCKNVFTIPNILSMFRILLIPIIIWLYCLKGDYGLTAIVLIISGATDAIDGYIARHYNMISDIGKALDPVADKLTQISMLYCLTIQFPLMLLPLGLLVIKEVTAAILGIMMIHSTKQVHSAVWHGKISTILLYSMMTLHILWINIPTIISDITIFVCTIVIILSFILYSIDYIKTLIKNKHQ